MGSERVNVYLTSSLSLLLLPLGMMLQQPVNHVTAAAGRALQSFLWTLALLGWPT